MQAGGGVDAATTGKALLREALLGDLRTINGSVSSLSAEKKHPALMDRFRLPDGHNDTELVATAQAFLTAISELELEDDLLALEHDENFPASLEAQGNRIKMI